MIEVSEVVITRNTASTFNLLSIATGCLKKYITDMIIKLKEHFDVHTTIAENINCWCRYAVAIESQMR